MVGFGGVAMGLSDNINKRNPKNIYFSDPILSVCSEYIRILGAYGYIYRLYIYFTVYIISIYFICAYNKRKLVIFM